MSDAKKPAKQNHVDEMLDEALDESFPASDPVGIDRQDHDAPAKPAPPKK